MKSILRPFELLLRHTVTYPLLRVLFRNPPHDGVIELTSVRRLLILRYDRIGDIVVTTPVFRKLKTIEHDLVLGVVASAANAELIRGNPYVDRVHVLPTRWLDWLPWIANVRREGYEVVLNFIFNRTTSGGVLANLVAPKGIKVGQGAEKYRFYFNKLLKLNRGEQHMAKVLLDYVNEVFGLPNDEGDEEFQLFPGPDDERIVVDFIQTELKPGQRERGYVVLNISAAERERKLSGEQCAFLAAFLTRECRETVVVVSAPADAGMRKAVVHNAGAGCLEFPRNGSAGLLTVAALIRSAFCVMTPDTSIIHIASAMKTPVLGFYTPLRVTNEWKPWGVKYEIVLAPPGLPVVSIEPNVIVDRARSFLKDLRGGSRAGA